MHKLFLQKPKWWEILWLICIITVLVLKHMSKFNSYSYIFKYILLFLIGIYVLWMLIYVRKELGYILRLKKYNIIRLLVFIVGLLIVFLIPFVVHILFYEGQITESDWLSFYGNFITFTGALSLGAFLYNKERQSAKNELKKKARMLYETMSEISLKFLYFDTFLERNEKLKTINAWEMMYYDIAHLVKYKEPSLKDTLEEFFGIVDSINNAIECNDKQKAKLIYNGYVKSQQISMESYNYIDAEDALLSIATGTEQSKPWYYKEKEKIEEFAEEFFDLVNVWIYNYMLSRGVEYCAINDIEDELVDWLLKHPEIREWVKHSFENRKIIAMIFSISLKMKDKSRFLNYCLAEYSFKNKDTLNRS